jgi:hypothetical protein
MAGELERAGFDVVTSRDENPEFAFNDIGAVIYHLRAVSWQIPDFDVQTYDQSLRRLDARIRNDGPFIAHDHRLLIAAERK